MGSPVATVDFYPGSEAWPHECNGGSSEELCPAQWAVLDTNQVLGHLEAVQYILSTMTGVNLVVPRIVIKELELMEWLEESSGSCQARTSLRYLQSQLLALDGFWCSSATDRSSIVLQAENEGIYQGLLGPKMRSKGVATPDDHVLACARYFASVTPPGLTELLTSDYKLSIDASFHGVPSESVLSLMSRLMPCLATTGAEYGTGIDELPCSDAGVEHDVWPESISPLAHNLLIERCVAAPPGLELTKAGRHAECGTSAPECGASAADCGCAASTDDDAEELSSSADSERPMDLPEVSENEPKEDQKEEKATAGAGSVVLRGLPFSVTKEEVLAFVLKAGVSRKALAPGESVTILANAQGRPTGFAEVRLAPGADFQGVFTQLHMQLHRGRYVEAFPSRPGR